MQAKKKKKSMKNIVSYYLSLDINLDVALGIPSLRAGTLYIFKNKRVAIVQNGRKMG